jgi:hypothetical protein
MEMSPEMAKSQEMGLERYFPPPCSIEEQSAS